MAGSRKFYLKDVARRWRQALAAAKGRVMIFSPYITLEAVQLVLGDKRPPRCDVYTAFRAQDFACGASSLAALRHLLAIGARLYQVPSLHAKVVIVPGAFASIGSQNLTGRGRRNHEATVVFTNCKAVERIERLAARWIELAEAIAVEQLDEMEEAIVPLKTQFAQAAEEARRVDQRLRRLELARVAAEERAAPLHPAVAGDADDGGVEDEATAPDSDGNTSGDDDELFDPDEDVDLHDPTVPADVRLELEADQEDTWAEVEARRRRRLEFFRQVVARAPQAAKAVRAEVALRDGKPSMAGATNATLTSWVLDGAQVRLRKYYRYMCILEDVCRWGWARVARTRISIICPRLMRTTPVTFGHVNYWLMFEAVWEDAARLQSNLKITVAGRAGDLPNASIATLDCWFGLDCLDLLEFHVGKEVPGLFGSDAERLSEWLSDNGQEFRAVVLPHILAPFKYAHKLLGRRADSFFGPCGTSVNVRLAKIEGHEVLVARREPSVG